MINEIKQGRLPDEQRIELFNKDFPELNKPLEDFLKKYPQFNEIHYEIKTDIIDAIENDNEGRDNMYHNRGTFDVKDLSKKLDTLGKLLLSVKKQSNNHTIFNNFQESIHTELDIKDYNMFYIYYDPITKEGHCQYIIKNKEVDGEYIPYIEQNYSINNIDNDKKEFSVEEGFKEIYNQIMNKVKNPYLYHS